VRCLSIVSHRYTCASVRAVDRSTTCVAELAELGDKVGMETGEIPKLSRSLRKRGRARRAEL
jgi:hypothetical protein